MGSTIAVYDYTVPRESGMKARKSPRRGAKRRGCRSGKGGRKRRALVGCAPEIPFTTPSKPLRVGLASSRHYKRRLAYSQALIDSRVKMGKTIVRMKERTGRGFSGLEEQDAHWATLQRLSTRYAGYRRSWFDLARKTDGPGSDPSFRQIRFNVLCQGIDEFHSRAMRKMGVIARQKRGLETQDEIDRGELATIPEPKPGCSYCQSASTKMPVCTRCGRALSKRNQKKGLPETRKSVAPWCEEHRMHSWRCIDMDHKPPVVLTRPKGKGRPSSRR